MFAYMDIKMDFYDFEINTKVAQDQIGNKMTSNFGQSGRGGMVGVKVALLRYSKMY